MHNFFFQIPELKDADEQGRITLEQDFFKDLVIILYVSLSLEILGFLASCFSFASSCTDYGEANKRKGFVMPWVIWCFIAMAFSIGCIVFFYTVLHGKIATGRLVYWFYANTVWLVFCAAVGICYIKKMKEGYRTQTQVMMTSVSEFHGNPSPYYKL